MPPASRSVREISRRWSKKRALSSSRSSGSISPSMNASTSSSSAVTSAVTNDLLQVTRVGGLELGADGGPERGEQFVAALVERARADRGCELALVAGSDAPQRGGVHGRVLGAVQQLALDHAECA